jgi:DNA-binding NarL/FixJ family response regulator
MNTRVTVIEENETTRNSIVSLLNADPEIEVVGEFSNAVDCERKMWMSRPHVVLMDIESADNSGIATVSLLTGTFPQIQILIRTASEDDALIFASIKAGSSGYILKNRPDNSMIKAIKELRQGGSPMSPIIASRVLNLFRQDLSYRGATDYSLTKREKEILKEIVKGQSHKMIGAELHISYETVRTHVKHIYEKLEVVSLTQVVAIAIRKNLV